MAISLMTAIIIAAIIVTAAVIITMPSAPSVGSLNFGSGSSPSYDSFGPPTNTISNKLPVAVILGKMKVFGNIIWQSEPGEVVKQIVVLCQGPINSISDIRINDKPYTDFTGVTITSYLGTSAQTKDSIVAALDGLDLRSYAYLAVTLTASDELTSSPTISCVVEGELVETYVDGAADSFTKLLASFDGADGATSFVASTGQTVTFVGTAQLDTAQKKFGASSLLLDGNSDYVTLPDSVDWAFGTGDFTIDMWVRFNDNTGVQVICGQYIDATNWIRLLKHTAHTLLFTIDTAGVEYTVNSSEFVTQNNTWYHIAVVRSGSTCKIYGNGTDITTSDTIQGNTIPDLASVLQIGHLQEGATHWYVNGWIDEVRISKGIARWTANFTPPTTAYIGKTWSGATFSENPAALIRHTLKNSRWGVGKSDSEVDDDTFGSAYDYFAEPVNNGAGGTEPRFRLNYIIDAQEPAKDHIDAMLSVCRASFIFEGKKIRLHVDKKEPVSFRFGDGSSLDPDNYDNIVKDSFKWELDSIDSVPNRLVVHWIDPDQKYNEVTVVRENRIDQEERAKVFTKDVALLGIHYQSQASREAKYMESVTIHNAVRASWAGFLDSRSIRLGQVVSITAKVATYQNKEFRIIAISNTSGGLIQFTGVEYNESLYDDRLGSVITTMTQPSGPNIFAPLSEVTGLILAEFGYQQGSSGGIGDGKHVANIDVTWVTLTDDEKLRLRYHSIEYSDDDGVTYKHAGYAGKIDTTFRITDIRVGVVYTVKVSTISQEGVKSNGVTGTVTINGKDDPPSDVTQFIVNQNRDRILFGWAEITDVDAWGYEVRWGSGWSSGIKVATVKGSNYLTTDFRTGVGQSYWIKALDNSGNYSSNALEATITIDNIPFRNIIQEYSEQTAWAGTKEAVIVTGDNIAISGDELIGTYTTPVRDLGYVATFKIGVESIVSAVSSDRFDSDATAKWNDSPTRRFTGEELPGASTFKVETSEDNVVWATGDYQAGDYKCRYFAVEMTLTRESTGINLACSQMNYYSDLPDVNDRGSDSVVSAATGDAVLFEKTYHQEPNVHIEITSGDGIYSKFTAKDTTGFTVILYDAAGTAKIGDYDWHSNGI